MPRDNVINEPVNGTITNISIIHSRMMCNIDVLNKYGA